eukprot:gene24243-29315_t
MNHPRQSLVKVLYIEDGLNEKSASRVLEDSVRNHLHFPCSFTVVPNAFPALECTEHTVFDLIISRPNLQQFNAIEMVKELRGVGCSTPMAIMVNEGEDLKLLSSTKGAIDASLVFDVVQRPLFASKLINLICRATGRLPTAAISTPRDSKRACMDVNRYGNVGIGIAKLPRDVYSNPLSFPSLRMKPLYSPATRGFANTHPNAAAPQSSSPTSSQPSASLGIDPSVLYAMGLRMDNPDEICRSILILQKQLAVLEGVFPNVGNLLADMAFGNFANHQMEAAPARKRAYTDCTDADDLSSSSADTNCAHAAPYRRSHGIKEEDWLAYEDLFLSIEGISGESGESVPVCTDEWTKMFLDHNEQGISK